MRAIQFLASARMILVVFLGFIVYLPGSTAGELSEVSEELRLELSLPDLSGKQRDLQEFSGKVVLVNFWASWCMPCIREMPGILRLAKEMQDKPFAVVGVNVGESERRAQAAARRLEIDFPVLLDKESITFKRWGATVLPTAYILDTSGQISYVGRGPLEWDQPEIVDKLQQLM